MTSEYELAARAAALDNEKKHTGKRNCKHCEQARTVIDALGLLNEDGTLADPPHWGMTPSSVHRDKTDSKRVVHREPPNDRSRFTTPEGLRNLSPEGLRNLPKSAQS